MLVKRYKSVKECAMNIRQLKLAAKKAHSSRYNAAKGKPTKNVNEMCDYRRSRKEAVVLRKAAHLFRSKEKHMEAYANIYKQVPESYDGFLGSEADVITLRQFDVETMEPFLPDLNVYPSDDEEYDPEDYDYWMFARDVHRENLMQRMEAEGY